MKLARADPHAVTAIPVLAPLVALDSVFVADVKPTQNHLATNDHVFGESPLQRPPNYPDLQSTSKDPKTAIICAYGIRPDRLNEPDHPDFYFAKQKKPNTYCAVATMIRETDDALARPTTVAAEGNAEVKRRIERDFEVLLDRIVTVEGVVKLPDFERGDVDGSLERAALALLDAGFASSRGVLRPRTSTQ